jgi:hypothetical protein
VIVTERDLIVARAARDAAMSAYADHARDIGALAAWAEIDLAALIAALPEVAPLPAPTEPGWWWADGQPVSVDAEGWCWVTGSEIERPTSAYRAWRPLAEPAKEG